MVKINKIYTKSGDQGQTHLVGGKLIRKSSIRVESYGDIDELNSQLGLIRTLANEKQKKLLVSIIARIQNDLFDIGSNIACDDEELIKKLPKIENSHISWLEKNIDESIKDLPELKSFVLPGGSIINSHLHIGRTICRRTERLLWKLNDETEICSSILIYVNRLSDLLFALARRESYNEQISEYIWVPGD